MVNNTIYRVTLFKIPEAANRQKLIDLYREMPQSAVKDGKPYIIAVNVGETCDDQRNQGYNLAATSVFASKEDMEYYDNHCAAHAALKAVAKQSHHGAMMVFFKSALEQNRV